METRPPFLVVNLNRMKAEPFADAKTKAALFYCCSGPCRLAPALSTHLTRLTDCFFCFSVLSVRAGSRPDIGDSLVSSSTMDSNQDPGTSSYGGDRSHEGHNAGASNRPRAGGASKGPVPKWFKGTGSFTVKIDVKF